MGGCFSSSSHYSPSPCPASCLAFDCLPSLVPEVEKTWLFHFLLFPPWPPCSSWCHPWHLYHQWHPHYLCHLPVILIYPPISPSSSCSTHHDHPAHPAVSPGEAPGPKVQAWALLPGQHSWGGANCLEYPALGDVLLDIYRTSRVDIW